MLTNSLAMVYISGLSNYIHTHMYECKILDLFSCYQLAFFDKDTMTSLFFFLFLCSYGMSSRSRRMKPATLLRCSWALTAVGAATARWAWVGSSHARPTTPSSPSTTPVGREKTQTCPRETCESCVFFPATCKYHKSQQQQQTLPTPSKNSFGQSLSYQAHAFLHTKGSNGKITEVIVPQPVVSLL